MRIYLPATPADLAASVLSARQAYAVTAELASALPDEDEEELEFSASLCAADASLVLLAEPGNEALADRRVVVAADVEADSVRVLPVSQDTIPGTVETVTPVTWDQVVALLVDEVAAEADVRAARTGDEEAFERAADADLLWFDATERGSLTAELA